MMRLTFTLDGATPPRILHLPLYLVPLISRPATQVHRPLKQVVEPCFEQQTPDRGCVWLDLAQERCVVPAQLVPEAVLVLHVPVDEVLLFFEK